MRFFLIVVITFLSTSVNAMVPVDSIGVERVGDVTFVLHRVEEKETLYSLSRRYDVNIKTIINANPSTENGLDIGQVVRIPINRERVPTMPEGIVHKVSPKETLFSIAQSYDVETTEIQEWNHFSTSLLDIGQELKIYPSLSKKHKTDVEEVRPEVGSSDITHKVGKGETLYSISRETGVPLDSLRTWNKLATNDISVGDDLIIGQQSVPVRKTVRFDTNSIQTMPQTPEIYASAEDTFNPTAMVADELSESGLAEAIEGSANNKRYLGLHRTVPVGTVMRVRNEMNGQEIFVRIIGKLPDTGANRNIVIKISESAYKGLGAIDDRFRVTVSYLP